MNALEFKMWNEAMSRIYDSSNWYDHIYVKLINGKKRLTAIRDICKNGRIIDIGCGAGQLIAMIKSKYPESDCYGLDLSEFALNNARKSFGSSITWINKNAEEITGFKKYFDVVICSEVIEHTLNPRKVIQQILKIAKPDAQIIMSVPNMDLVNRAKNVFKALFNFSSDDWHLQDMNMSIFQGLIKNRLLIEKAIPIPHSLMPLWIVTECSQLG